MLISTPTNNPVKIGTQNVLVNLIVTTLDTTAKRGGCMFQVQELSGANTTVQFLVTDNLGGPPYIFQDVILANATQNYDVIFGSGVNAQPLAAPFGSSAAFLGPTIFVVPRDLAPRGDFCSQRTMTISAIATTATPNLLIGPPVPYEF